MTFLCLGGALLLACGAPASPPRSAPAAPAVHAPAQPEPRAGVEAPLPAPPDLTGIILVKNGLALQRGVRDLAAGAFPILSHLTVNSAAEAFLGAALADVVDLAKRVDVGFLESGDYAASLALASFDDAQRNLAEDFELAPREKGVLALIPHKDGEKAKVHCEIRPAAGDSPYRLVCGSRANALRALGPYLVQTVAREGMPADATLRWFRPALSMWSDNGATPGPQRAAFFELGREAANDIGSVEIDARLGPDRVDAEVNEVFRSTRSPITRIALAHARETKPVPDLFWKLPADALAAAYARGAEKADLELLQKLLLRVIEMSIREQTTSEEMVEGTRRVLSSTLLTGGPIAVAYGFDLSGAVSAISNASVQHPLERPPLHGWFLAGLEEPPSRWADALHEAVLLQRLPMKPPAGMLHKREDATLTRLEELPLTDAKLSPHSVHFALREYATAKGKAKGAPKWTFHVLVVPDGARTWLAMGENQDVVVAKVKETIAAGSDAGLAGRSDLQSLHGGTGFAGFVSPGFFHALSGPSDPADPVAARTFLERMSGSLDAEAAPITFVLSAGSGKEDGVELRIAAPNEAAKRILSMFSRAR